MNKVISREYVEKNYIHKDKIREKINEINSMFVTCDEDINCRLRLEDKAKIEFLRELLEETKDDKI